MTNGYPILLSGDWPTRTRFSCEVRDMAYRIDGPGRATELTLLIGPELVAHGVAQGYIPADELRPGRTCMIALVGHEWRISGDGA